MEEHSRLWISILTAIIGLAIVSVILSKSAKTVEVIKAAASGFGGILGVAVSPVTGTAPPSLGPPASQASGNPAAFPSATNVNFTGGGGNSNDPLSALGGAGGILNLAQTAAPFAAAFL